MELSSQILSDITVFMKYAKHLESENRRESWSELVLRSVDMHIKKYPQLKQEILDAFDFVFRKDVVPSMRSLQFGGKPIELSPNRTFNCSYLPVDNWHAFHEIMFLLLGGTGVGYSVQKHHIAQLPDIKRPTKRKRRHLIADTIEGWADAVKVLVKSYFFGESELVFDFSGIRPKGSPLKTSGGRAPGAQPLKDCLHNLEKILSAKEQGSKLTPLEVHDIICHIADAVLSGGIRRAACLAGFSIDDEEMLSCKYGNWFERNPQRARANNSVVLARHKIKEKQFFELWDKISASRSGEPGIYFTNNTEWLTNPCQPAWATVLTPEGISTIGNIKIGDRIWSGKQWTKVTNKWSTGVKSVYGYHTRSGTFYGTENHRVVSFGEKIEVKDAETIDTCQGPFATSFMPTCESELHEAQIYVMDGLVVGDGSAHKASNNLIGLHIGEKDKDYFKDPVGRLIKEHRPGVTPTFYEIETTISSLDRTYNRRIPDTYRFGTAKRKALFLRGIYSANGSVVASRVSLKSASLGLIQDVQEMLSSLGIRSYYTINKAHDVEFENGVYECKESYDLNISTDRKSFRTIIGFIQDYKTEKLNKICDGNTSYRPKLSYEIVSRELVSTEEVFDLTVEADEHTYWTGGLLVSNCAEIALRPHSFCNLTEINASDIKSQEELNARAKSAAFIGTLQAGYTDFHYLREIWKETSEKDSLLGVSMTGIASGNIYDFNIKEAAEIVKEENKRVAKLIGIKPAARMTCVKPSGTTSLVLGTSSGIHAWHSKYYIRRVTVLKSEPIYAYLARELPKLLEDDYLKSSQQAYICIPIKAPHGSTYRSEKPLQLLERVKHFYHNWVIPGHERGDNTHSISATVSVKDGEWDEVGHWMWENRNFYNGLSVLPYNGGTYMHAPFEECTKEKYEEMLECLKEIDLTEVVELEDNTSLSENVACGSGGCEIT